MNDSRDAGWLGLAGKVCVVTGAGSGIGAETARRFAAAGSAVAVLDCDGHACEKVVAEIAAAGGRALAVQADVADEESVGKAALQVLAQLGSCSVLVNNAGVQYAQQLMEVDLAKWRRALDVNLTGALICAQAFARQMIDARQGGSIVNVGSITGTQPKANGGAYSPSKAALAMLSRQLAVALAEHGIRSNTVEPGFVRTPLSEYAYADPQLAQARNEMVPLGRAAATCDIAEVILYLASNRAAYVTGQALLVDGGLSQILMGLVPRPRARPEHNSTIEVPR
jgi:NAD(P)-dependent dehydrogenase (short-subunit alcohol dehydrogenase family)